MSILQRLTRVLRPPMELRQLPAYGGYSSNQYGRAFWPRNNLSTYYGYYDQVVVAFACINLIADAAAAAKVRVYDSAKDDVELPDHPMRQLLAAPNDYMSEAEFLNTMVKLASVSGFAVAEKERANAGRVIGLHPLRSDWLKAVPRQNNMTDWEYKLPSGETFPLLAEDVVAWTYQASPMLTATGTTPLAAASRELAIETSMVNFTKAFFDGGGVPMTGLVVADDASYDQAEADVIRERFMQLANEPWKPVVLESIKDVRRIGMDLNEMAYKDLRHLTSTQICTAFRVPPVMLGTLAGLENSPWSKYEEARKSFYEDTITPLWARLDGALTRSLLPDFEANPNISLEFDTSEIPAFQEDDSADWAKANIGVTGGWLPVNRALQMVGQEPVQGGDVFLRSIATVEVPATTEQQNGSRSMNGHAKIEALSLAKGNPLVGSRIAEALHGPSRQANDWRGHSLPARAAAPSITTQSLPIGMMRRLPIEQRARVAATNKQHIVKIGERGAVWLRKFWRDQGERIIDQVGLRYIVTPPDLLNAGNSPIAHRAVDAIDWDEEERLLTTQLSQIHHLAGKTAYRQASDLLGVEVSWDVANPNIVRTLEALGRRVVGINDSTRSDVQRVLGDSLSEGASLADIADNLRGLFVETYKGRSETVGRSESMTAYNQASTLGYRESGVVSMVELVDNPDHTEDYGASDGLTCADRDGLLVELDAVDRHIDAEHPNGSLAVIPVLSTALGEE